MKKIKVRFERDKTLGDEITVVVRAAEQDAQVNALIDRLSHSAGTKLTVLDGDGCACIIDESEIILVSSDGKQANVTTRSAVYRARQSLQSIEEQLGRQFLRVSRFELINLSAVRRYDFTIGGTLRIEFDNGMETWASRRYIPLIKERLSEEEGTLC